MTDQRTTRSRPGPKGKTLRPWCAILLAALLSVASMQAVEASSPQQRPVDLAELLTLEGDQVVVVPDGNYEGVSVEAPHPATDGPLAGWLVLVAETTHGVTVTGDLRLEDPTSRILFVGFKFSDARVFNFGSQIAYWYADHVYPDADWYEAERPIPRQFFVRAPATDVAVYGSDFHDGVASPINVSGVTGLELVGVRVWDLSEPVGSDPEDLSHLNTISLLGGSVTDMTVRSSTLEGARANHQTDFGDVVRLTYEDVWYTAAWGSAFQFNATNGNQIRESARIDVRSWGHTGANPKDRIDIVDGRVVDVEQRSDRVDVTDTDLSTLAPPIGAQDPATRWREAHPYDTWRSFFGWDDVEPEAVDAVEAVEAVAAVSASAAEVAESPTQAVVPESSLRWLMVGVGGVAVAGVALVRRGNGKREGRDAVVAGRSR